MRADLCTCVVRFKETQLSLDRRTTTFDPLISVYVVHDLLNDPHDPHDPLDDASDET